MESLKELDYIQESLEESFGEDDIRGIPTKIRLIYLIPNVISNTANSYFSNRLGVAELEAESLSKQMALEIMQVLVYRLREES